MATNTFSVKADDALIERGKNLMSQMERQTQADALSAIFDIAEREMALNGSNVTFQSHIKAITDSLKNIENSVIGIVSAAEEQRKRESKDLMDTLASRDKTIQSLQERGENMETELDSANETITELRLALNVAERDKNELLEAANQKEQEYFASLDRLHTQIDEQSQLISLLRTQVATKE